MLSSPASCLVLNLENGVWDGNMMGQLPQPRLWHATVSMKNIGTYLIGGAGRRTTDFLPEGSTEWTAGPDIPLDMNQPCAVQTSDDSYLIIDNTDIREYQVDISDPTSKRGLQSAANKQDTESGMQQD